MTFHNSILYQDNNYSFYLQFDLNIQLFHNQNLPLPTQPDLKSQSKKKKKISVCDSGTLGNIDNSKRQQQQKSMASGIKC